MGLTVEQWHKRIEDNIISYVKDNGIKEADDIYIWKTYPICVKDICVDGVEVKNNKLSFGDFSKNKFVLRRKSKDVERKYLEDAFSQMKESNK